MLFRFLLSWLVIFAGILPLSSESTPDTSEDLLSQSYYTSPLRQLSSPPFSRMHPTPGPLYSFISIRTEMPDDQEIILTIKSQWTAPLSINIKPQNGQIHWNSLPLRPGVYEISYILPKEYEPISPEQIHLKLGANIILNPKLTLLPKQTSIHITTNVPEAQYTLLYPKSSQIWKGEGREFNFSDIPAGTFVLSFASSNPDFYIPPQEMRFRINEKENKEIKASFQLAGKLTIKTNFPGSTVTIQELGRAFPPIQDQIRETSKAFTLPEGQYRITMSPPTPNQFSKTLNYIPSEPVEVSIKALNIAEINLPFQINNTPTAPKPVKATETENGTNLQSTAETSLVASGRAIIGDATSDEKINESPAKIVTLDAFNIGIYEITNAQYAAWLNQALKAGEISFVEQADYQGQVLDLNGNLLFKTFRADPFSQISAQKQSVQGTVFFPLPGKNLYPVINVSWYGAMAYCHSNHCRLPTEAEWEMAASMEANSPGEPLTKFIYGFSKNEIDLSWANYRNTDQIIQHFRVLTTPVGFYNGVNSLPLSSREKHQQVTHLAKSPSGAFDMSGNVWEWVSDWYDDSYYENMPELNPKGPYTGIMKVVKGGCYDSLSDGVRVSERLGLLPNHCDAYTGFRIAVDEP